MTVDQIGRSFVHDLIEHLAFALQEVQVLTDPVERARFVSEMALPDSVDTSNAVGKAQILVETLEDFDPNTASVHAYTSMLNAARDVIQSLEELFHGDAAPPANWAGRAVGYFINRYLQRRRPWADATLLSLGILDGPAPLDESEGEQVDEATDTDDGDEAETYDVLPRTFHPSRILKFFRDPAEWLATVYGRENGLDLSKAFARVGYLAHTLGMGAPFHDTPEPTQAWLGIPGAQEMRIPLLRLGEHGFGEAGIALAPLKALDGRDALLATFYVSGNDNLRLYAGTLFDVQLTGDFTLPHGLGLVLERGRRPTLVLAPGIESDDLDVASIGVEVVQREPVERLLVGGPAGLRVGLRRSSFGAGFRGDPRQRELFAELRLNQVFVGLDTTKLDGFLARILPLNLESEFELVAGWSTWQGFYMAGSGSLQTVIPIHRRMGPVTVRAVQAALDVGKDEELGAEVRASFGVQLGPIAGSVEGIGVGGRISFPDEKQAPNLSGLQFLPPEGVGLSIDAGGITGGGFLDFNEAEKRYAGILQLGFGDIGLTAIGLITTQLPGGRDGYSMLAVIGSEFSPPIQLPYGFTLSGVGGLIGVHRTMLVDVLRDGLKNHTLDSILFPQDPILNASRIISDLESVFPSEEGRFVFGPMAKIGWGTPNLLTADLAILLELPEPVRLVLLGQIEAKFPKKDDAIVVLHVDTIGVIEFAKKSLALDATLYDSRILAYNLSGDGALRLTWGDDPQFAMSLGGFHPRFSPPPAFPSLRRLTLDLSKSSSLKLSCRAYQALTSNTLQFGANVDFYVKSGGASLDGGMGFDTLIHFSPFSFRADVRARLVARYRGRKLAGVRLDLTLSGPTPWRAKGRATFEILWWDVKVRFNKSWGRSDRTVLDAVDPWAPFREALERPESWAARLPPGATMVERLKTLEAPPGTVFVHPAGALEVRQRVLPLGLKLAKLGNAPVKDHDTFRIDSVYVGEDNAGRDLTYTPLKDDFARAQYEDLNTSQKLSLPSFEKLNAGVAVTSRTFRLDGSSQTFELAYESIVIDGDGTSRSPTDESGDPVPGKLPLKSANRLVRAGVAGRAATKIGGLARFRIPGANGRVRVGEERYVVVRGDNLVPVETTAVPGNDGSMSRIEADQAMSKFLAQNANEAGEVLVVPAFEAAT